MPCFPQPGSVTVCEINRDLITSESLSDDGAKETYGKILGMTFSPVPFQSEVGPPPTPDHETPPTKGFLQSFFHPNHVSLLPEVDLQGLSWHPHKHVIAFICGFNQVLVRDYEDSEGKEPCILANESQKDVKVLEWRPNGGRTLAVACSGGICIWAASFPGSVPSVRSGASSFLGTLSRGSGIRYTLVDFLRSHNKEQITALSWSPDGRYLASGSYESSSFTIWDVAQGIGTPIRRGLAGISILKWSPTGDYFFSAKFDGSFYLWETNTWVSESWSSTTGFVKGIEKIAWDASGERLAVSFKDCDELYSGLIAIYDVRRTPLISASLIGFIRGPGECPKPIAFSFHDKFKQGPLLSVCWSSGFCCTYPLIFRSHILP
ncbi:hypothetical protein ACLB2K_068557 [Fragaria x ananassa]